MTALAIFLVNLIVAIGLHEAAHYWAFRYYGWPVEKVSVGFGPGLRVWTTRDGTQWKLCLILLGGYCSPLFEKTEDWMKPGPGAVVAFAGPAANIVLAVLYALIPSEIWPDSALWAHLNFLAALLNLAPIPPLDGGRIMYSGVRTFFGDVRALAFKAWAYPVGLIIVLGAQVASCFLPASAIEARRAETHSGSVNESAAPKADAPEAESDAPGQEEA